LRVWLSAKVDAERSRWRRYATHWKDSLQRLERALAIVSLKNPTSLRGRDFVRVVAATSAFLAVLVVAALNQHAPYDIQAGVPARAIAGVAPLLAAAVA
jgi:hypothetical protein